jgi:hypothetical protein
MEDYWKPEQGLWSWRSDSFVQPVIVDRMTGRLIDDHLRVGLAKAAGHGQQPCLSEKKAANGEPLGQQARKPRSQACDP